MKYHYTFEVEFPNDLQAEGLLTHLKIGVEQLAAAGGGAVTSGVTMTKPRKTRKGDKSKAGKK